MKQITILSIFFFLASYGLACNASISHSDTVCLENGTYPVTFAGSGGTAPYTFHYSVNGGPVQTITSVSGSSATLLVNIPGTGNYHYDLIQVSDASGCVQPVNQSIDVLVTTSPSVYLSGSTTVYQNSTPFPIVTFTAVSGVGPYTFHYTINGGPVQSITSAAGSNQAFLPVPTASTGTFFIQLLNVNSGILCPGEIPDTYPTAIVNVIPNPPPLTGTASINGSCSSSTITLTASGGSGAPYTYTYTINGVTSTVTGGSSLIIAGPSANFFPETYTLAGVSVSSGSATAALPGSGSVYLLPSTYLYISSSATSVCANSPGPVITFSNSNYSGPVTYIYNINGGPSLNAQGNSQAFVTVPTNVPGTYVYTLTGVGMGCSMAPVSVSVTVRPSPTATISGTASVCQHASGPAITFTGVNGTAPYTFTYNINGGPNQTVSSTSGPTATLFAPTAAPGTFAYSLVSVSSAAGCSQNQGGTTTITIRPIPTATISGTGNVCKNAVSPAITFTGANGSSPYTFTYTLNGGANQTTSSGTGTTATINAPTAVEGTFTYSLVNVSSAGCSQSQTGTAAITVAPLPTATLAGTGTVCQDAASPLVTFTGDHGATPYVFTYNINGGASQTVSGGAGNTATTAAPTGNSGTFVYNLVSVTAANGCFQSQAGSATITIDPLPEATISGTSATCIDAGAVITLTGSSGTEPYIFTYTVDGGSPQTIASAAGGTANIPVTATASGTFTYDLVAISAANGCFQSQVGSLPVTVHPSPAATISGSLTVCQNSPDVEVTFKGSNGAAPYLFTYNINGAGSQTISSGPTDSAVVALSTAVPGTFTCNLLSVSSADGCVQNLSDSTMLTVAPLPEAVVSGSLTVCQDAPDPVVTFTGSNGISPYTFTYDINGGAPQTVSGGTGNTATITVATSASGTITCHLLAVSGGNGCFQSQSGTANIIVSPLPAADVSGNGSACENGISPEVIFTGSGGTAPYEFTYNINGGISQTVSSGSGTTAALSVPTSTPGSISYHLLNIADAAGCAQSQAGTGIFTIDPLPIITGLTNICRGSAVQLSGDGAPDPVAPWSSSDPSIATVDNSGLVTATGSGTSYITYTHANGCSFSSPVTVPAPPVASISGNATICSGDIASFTIAGDPGATVVYTDGISSFTIILPASGNMLITGGPFTDTTHYTLVSVQGPAPTSCLELLSESITIAVDPLPVAGAMADISICAGTEVAVQEFSATPACAALTWTNSNTATGLAASGSGSIGDFTALNSQPVSVVSTIAVTPELNGCTGQPVSFQITVYPLPVAHAGPDQLACQNDGQIYQVGASPVAGSSYSWSPASGLNDAFIANPEISNVLSGTMAYTVTVTDAQGCQNTDEVVLHQLTPPVVLLTASATAGCQSGTITFELGASENVSVAWFVNGSHISGNDDEPVFSTSFGSPGIYSVIVVATNAAGCSATDSIAGGIQIYPEVDAGFTTVPNASQVNEFTDHLNLVNQSENATSYGWYFNGTPFSTDQHPVLNFPPGYGTIEILLIAENNFGCADTAILSITPLNQGVIYVPNTFTPDGDGINDIFFPVISDGFDLVGARLEIYDRWGELIFESTGNDLGWNGFYKGELCKTDTYVWKLTAKAVMTDFVKSLTGHVNLLR